MGKVARGDLQFTKETRVSGTQLAAFTGIHRTDIGALSQLGVITPDGNLFPFIETVTAIIKHLKEKTKEARRDAKGVKPENSDRARLEKARADIMEQEAQRRSGRTIDIDEAEKALTGVYTNFRTRMLAVPTRAAPQVINEDAAGAHAILTDLIEEGLRELSTNELRAASAHSGASRTVRAPYIPSA